MNCVTLNKEQLQWCYKKAWERYNKYLGNTGERYHNTDHGHRLGYVGELAVYYFLHRNGVPDVQAHFHEDDRLPDLTARGRDIEVKTWTDYNWDFYGRCIAEAQLPLIQNKHYIIWATTPHLPDEVEDNHTVTIKGYSLPVDFENMQPKNMGPRQILNRQVNGVRDIGILLGNLR